MKQGHFKQSYRNPGIVTNAPTDEVAWSTGRNVRFRPGAIYKSPGKSLLATVPGALPIRDMFTFKGHDGIMRTIVCCDTKIFAYKDNFTSYTDITPTPAPSSGANDVWQFSMIGGMPVLSNGINPMWKWADFASPMTIVNNAPTVCRRMTTAHNRVLVGNIQEGASNYPSRIGWSGITAPEMWTRDLKASSGRKDLVNPSTALDAIETIQAFGRNLVYTERNVWGMKPGEFPEIFNFPIEWEEKGLVAPRAHAYNDGVSYFLSHDEVYPIGLKDRSGLAFDIRNSVFPNLNKNAINTAFSFFSPSTKELFICVPTGSNTGPDTAFILQLETKAWSICDCNYLCHTYAFDESGYTWDTIPYGAWDSIADSRWDELWKTGIIPYEIVGNADGEILRLDSGDNDNGDAITGYIETGDINMKDPFLNKTLNEILPMVKPQADRIPLLIQAGTRDSLNQDINWSEPTAYNIGSDNKADFRNGGKYIRLRFYTDGLDSPWTLEGYGYKYSIGGSR